VNLRFWILLSSFVLVVGIGGLQLWGDYPTQGHEFSSRCDFCHITTPQKGKTITRFTRSISYLCLECHSVPQDNSHPVGIIPTMDMPEGFLLDWSGKMTCATCHDPHSESRNQYLRTTLRGRDFCILCHGTMLPLNDPHVGSVGVAHSKRGVYYDDSTLSQILDPISMECLGCHDGVIASDASYNIVGSEAVTYQQIGLSHPIGMDYNKVANEKRGLRTVAELSPYIALYNGKVGCASCHNPYSSEHRMLTLNNRGSALCMECHIK
jgi:predicted CXXCH cytochrome family protein